MSRFHRHLPFGAEIMPDGRTRFRLWAPDAGRVQLVVDGLMQHFELEPQAGGWFEASAPVSAGARYRYRIDDELEVHDPAARFAPDGLGGASEVVDPHAYEWRDSAWSGQPWHRAVVYELHVGTFTPEGSYAAIVPRLSQLADLGINTIELMPIATFPGTRGWGYDGVLPFAPHPAYGQPDDLKRLVDAAHAHGIAMVLDVVYNHFGPEGNYLHRYASGFFTDRYKTPWGPALDFESEAGRNVRQFFIENALYWLEEYRFDGLRLDAIHAMSDASRTHLVDELAAAIESGPAHDRHVHLILENHGNQASRLRPARNRKLSKAQWNDDFHHIVHVLVTGERDGYYVHYAEQPYAQLARVLAEGFAYQGDPYGAERKPRGERSDGLPVTSFIDFLQNHDQTGNRAFGERLIALTGEEPLRAAFALLLLSPHIPMLFMGEEYGARQPFLYFCDYRGELARAITEGRRGEFSAFKTFEDAHDRQRIPDPNAAETFERSRLRWEDRKEPAHRQHMEYVRQLLGVRAEHIAPRIPSIEPDRAEAEVTGARVHVRWPTDGSVLHLEANMAETSCPRNASGSGRLLFSTALQPSADRLAAWEVRLSVMPSS
jgi:maltooligosyltrehalose trehalohydrolase